MKDNIQACIWRELGSRWRGCGGGFSIAIFTPRPVSRLMVEWGDLITSFDFIIIMTHKNRTEGGCRGEEILG